MLSPDSATCVEKIQGCVISEEDQPDLLILSSNAYVCPKCLPGYYKDEEGRCQLCGTSEFLQEGEPESCLECITASRCTKCRDDMIVTYLEDGCQYPIEYCVASEENYINNGEYFICPQCEYGYYAEGQKCVKCVIENCNDCSAEDLCLECKSNFWMTQDSQYCYEPIDDCTGAEYVEYEIVDEEFIPVCTNCTQFFGWNYDETKCDDCSTIIENCIDCDHDVCLTCDANFHQTPDLKHCEPDFTNCNDDASVPIPYRYGLNILTNEYWCSNCKEGYYWSTEFGGRNCV